MTLKAGADCKCTGPQSLTIHPGVVVEPSARAVFESEDIRVKNKVEAKTGA